MKVYVVGRGYAFEREVCAVYSTREKAEQALEAGVGEDIEEHEFDPNWAMRPVYVVTQYSADYGGHPRRRAGERERHTWEQVGTPEASTGITHGSGWVSAKSTVSYEVAEVVLDAYIAEHSLEMVTT